MLPPGNTLGAPNAARLSPPAFDYNPLVYGHVNERIPFFIFGHEFEERPVPDCLFEGHHANMRPRRRVVEVEVEVARSIIIIMWQQNRRCRW